MIKKKIMKNINFVQTFFCKFLEIYLSSNSSNSSTLINSSELTNLTTGYNISSLAYTSNETDKYVSRIYLEFESNNITYHVNSSSKINGLWDTTFNCENKTSDCQFYCIFKTSNSNNFTLTVAITLTVVITIVNSIALTVLVRSTPDFRRQSFFRYILLGIILNCINGLVTWMAFYLDNVLIFFEVYLKIDSKIYLFFTFVFTTFCSWNYVLILIDNYWLVRFPLYQIRTQLKFQIIVILTLLLLSILLNLQHFGFENIKIVPNDSDSFHQVLYFTIIEVIIPFILRVLFSILTFRERVVRRMRANPTNLNLRNDIKVFRIISALNLCFLAFNLPYCIALLIDTYKNKYSVNIWILDAFIVLRFTCFYFEIFLFCFLSRVFRESLYTWFTAFFFRQRLANNHQNNNIALQPLNN